MTVGEPPVAADALEADGQHVQQEAADELVGRERHGPVAGFVTVVLALEQDRIAIKAQQPVVRDGDAMRVAAQVIEHLCGAAKRWFRVDDPLRVSSGREPGGERSRITQRLELAMEAQRAGIERAVQLVEKEPPEEPREDPNGQEEAWPAGDPAFAVRGDAAARYHAMHVRMV